MLFSKLFASCVTSFRRINSVHIKLMDIFAKLLRLVAKLFLSCSGALLSVTVFYYTNDIYMKFIDNLVITHDFNDGAYIRLLTITLFVFPLINGFSSMLVSTKMLRLDFQLAMPFFIILLGIVALELSSLSIMHIATAAIGASLTQFLPAKYMHIDRVLADDVNAKNRS